MSAAATQREKLKISVRTINPTIAKAMLGHMVENRSVSPARVKRYEGAMNRGEWQVGDPIMVNCDGRVIEGQHRLHAVIKSGKSIRFVVIEGYDPKKTFGIVGGGKERSSKDWFDILGDKNAGIRASAMRLLEADRRGVIHLASHQHVATPKQLCDLRAEVEEQLAESMAAVPTLMGRVVSRATMVYCHFTFAEKDKTLADVFMDGLATGEQLRGTDPVHGLREQFLRAKADRNAQLRQQTIIAVTRKAWNMVRKDKRLKGSGQSIKFRGNESFPEVL